MGSNPLERFESMVLKAVEKEKAEIFGITLRGVSEVVITPLSRRKSPPLTYKISATKFGQWVVKFNPLGPKDPWSDVKKEYGILQALYLALPVPKPIYASTDNDERMVGTPFIVMEYVQGENYGCASEVPAGKRSLICTAAMKAMTKVHRRFWIVGGQKKQEGLSRDFWHKQVSTWCNNYSSELGGESTRRLFRTMQSDAKPNGRNTVVVHGDADISNFIFERSCSGEYNVKAILDWKYNTNGDPMVDVGYFLMMFLQPAVYGYQSLARLDLLIGPSGNGTPSERQLLDAYYAEARRHNDAPARSPKHAAAVVLHVDPGVQRNFSRAYQQSVIADDRTWMLSYAKAVSCLRLISVVEAAWKDGWKGHESGQHAGIRNHPEQVIDMLTAAGWSFHG